MAAQSSRPAVAGLALGEAGANGACGGVIGAAARADLAVKVRHVPLDGVRAQPEPPGDLGIGFPPASSLSTSLSRGQATG